MRKKQNKMIVHLREKREIHVLELNNSWNDFS